MHKKIVHALIIIFLLTLTTVGFCAGAVKLIDFSKISDDNNIHTTTQKEDAKRKEQIDALLSEQDNIENLNTYDILCLSIDAVIDNPIEYNNILYNIEYFKELYNLSDNQINYIYELIINGKNVYDILDICYFWTETNEDIEIIEQIYNLKYRYKTDTWIENAFNRITNNKCGVLETEDVEEYIRKGLSTEDIVIANKLCRQGILTIQDILKMRLENKSFVEISLTINASSIKENHRQTNVFETKTNSINLSTYESNISSNEVIAANELSQITNTPLTECYQVSMEKESLDEELKSVKEKISEEVENRLSSNGIYKPVSTDEMIKYYSERSVVNE